MSITHHHNHSFNLKQKPGSKIQTAVMYFHINKAVSAVTGLEWPRGFQEVKVPRFHDNGTGWW
jgi:hypothetical protein